MPGKRKTRHRKPGAGRTALPSDQVTLPTPQWDMGASGPANRRGQVIEERGDIDPATGRRINPNGVRGARRVDPLEAWLHVGKITHRGYAAAVRLRDAFEQTMRAPGWPDNDRVQSSPKPDHAVTIQIDRLSRFHRVARHIAAGDRAIVHACVIHALPPDALRRYRGAAVVAGFAHLRDALERLADAMGG
jgi:hypothetical protein